MTGSKLERSARAIVRGLDDDEQLSNSFPNEKGLAGYDCPWWSQRRPSPTVFLDHRHQPQSPGETDQSNLHFIIRLEQTFGLSYTMTEDLPGIIIALLLIFFAIRYFYPASKSILCCPSCISRA